MPNPIMLIVVILIKNNFTAFHTMCPPLQASCTSSYPALPKEPLLSSCFLLCFIIAAQKYLGHWRNVPLTLSPEIWVSLAQVKPFLGGFSAWVSIPKLCVPASSDNPGAPAFLRGTDRWQPGINAPLGKSHSHTSHPDTAVKIQQWHLVNGKNSLHTSFKTCTSHCRSHDTGPSYNHLDVPVIQISDVVFYTFNPKLQNLHDHQPEGKTHTPSLHSN